MKQTTQSKPFSLSTIRWSIWIFIVSSIGLYSCKDTSVTGSFNENLPPSTTLTINEVNRTGADRLSSQIRIQWSGDDPDGFVIGFEYTFNNDTLPADWSFTTRTDSVFVLPIPNGSDTADVRFRVRAIDNDSLRDPSAATVLFPIKNTAPVVRFIQNETPSDTTFPVFNIGWTLNDIDGLENISTLQIKVNDADWFDINKDENFILFDIDENNLANVFYGLNKKNSGIIIEDFKINDDNSVLIKASDNAGAISAIDTTNFYIKGITSKILLIDDYDFNEKAKLNIHLNSLDALNLSYDVLSVFDNQIPNVLDPTAELLLNKWKFIYIASANLDKTLPFIQVISNSFLNDNNGKLFAPIPMKRLSVDHPLFSFLPITGFSTVPDSLDYDGDGIFDAPSGATSFRLPLNRYAKSNLSGLDSLRIKRTLTGLAPVQPASGSQILYEVSFQYQVPNFPFPTNYEFLGSKTICVKNAESSIIYFSLDFNDVQIGTLNHLGPLVQKLCVEQLGFSSN